MKSIIMTGFEPFGGEKVNPAWEAVRRLPDLLSPGDFSFVKASCNEPVRVIKKEIPTVRGAAFESIRSLVDSPHTGAVIAVGQAGGASSILLEKVAVNLDDFRIPDNAGNEPHDEPVLEGAPAAYFSTLPLRSMEEKLKEEGLPAALSLSAGSFVCNHLFYHVQHFFANAERPVMSGFIHVPYIPAQTADKPRSPSMAIDDIVKALRIILEVTALHL